MSAIGKEIPLDLGAQRQGAIFEQVARLWY